MTLRLRLTIFYGVFFMLVVSAVAVSVYFLTERSLTGSLELQAERALDNLQSGDLLSGMRSLPGDALHEIVVLGPSDGTELAAEAVRRGVSLYLPPVYRPSPAEPRLSSLLPADALERLAVTGAVDARLNLPDGGPVLVHGRIGNLEAIGRPTGVTAAFVVAVPALQTARTLDRLAHDLGRTVMFALLAFATGVYLLSSQVLRPLERVTQAASSITGQQLDRRVPVPESDDEMRELAVTLNRMLARLQESFEAQRRFTADASHELRTPVTAITGHVNYLVRRTRPRPDQLESLDVIRREADRMGKLVNDLLELARADAGFTIERQPVNLVDVAHDVVVDLDPIEAAEVTLHASAPLLEVEGDAGRLKQVVLNLVQNATQAGASQVRLEAREEDGRAVLEVADNGPGVPQEALPHLFDRFFRVDGARSTRGNGSGLGLAIVKWIVTQHDGEVTVESKAGEGTLFTVELPLLTRTSANADNPVV